MIDFKIPDETKAIRDKVRNFVQSECHPAEENCTAENFDEVLAGLRKTARSQGLWCPFVPEEHGGMGLRPLANALVQMELGESFLGALALNTRAGRRDYADTPRTRYGLPKRKVLETVIKWRETYLLLDDRKSRWSRCYRHANQGRA